MPEVPIGVFPRCLTWMEGCTETRNAGIFVSVNEDTCLEKCERLNRV
jgi:hypothetical protein